MSNSLIFTPVQAKEEKIQSTGLQTGWLYFATDTGRMYLDTETERVNVGGAGAALYYGKATDPVENKETLYWHLPINSLEDQKDNPKIDDIILNKDGAFYRILAINSTDFICSRLAVSGNGSSTGPNISSEIRPEINVVNNLNTTSLINGQDFSVFVTVSSYLTASGIPYDNLFTVQWTLTDVATETVYKKGNFDAQHNVEIELPLGDYLRDNTTTKITVWATGGNHDKESRQIGPTVTTSALYLALPSSFSSLKVYDEPNNISFTCNAYGDMDRTVIFYFGENDTLSEIGRKKLNTSSSVECTCKLPADLATHGAHTVRIELYQQYLNGDLGLQAEPIQFEIAIKDGISEKPIIWLGEYQQQYYSYDSIVIPYAIYNPTAASTDIILKKDNIQIGTHEDKANTVSSFYKWEIAGTTIDQMNYYQICCGDEGSDKYVQREISFKVEVDPDRNVVPISGYTLYFDPKGRSNDESAIERSKWSQDVNGKEIVASFEDFNWRNNGWLMDETLNTSYLKVSNGAKFTLPLGTMIFAGGSQSQQSHTIEMQLKISNNQLYSNLITNITRYKVPEYNQDTGEITYVDDKVKYKDNDNTEYALYEQSDYTNYDKFLLDYFSAINSEIYDLLVFKEVKKNIDISKAVCTYINSNGKIGIAIGTQDAFFSNGAQTVNVSFVEDDLINLTFIYNDALKLLEIFINGVISGVIKSDIGSFTIDSNLVFNSEYCDINIYSIRIYDKELNINNIVHNFAVDRKDIEIFDQVNKYNMAIENTTLKEFQLSYKSIQDYNDKNPDNPTIPYIIFDTTAYKDNKLPWSKKITRNIPIEFINVPLEKAYESGELVELAIADGLISSGETDNKKIQEGVKTYYKHHCPSWTSTLLEEDTNEIVVQGTSSEFYPRRNFKVKTKIKDVKIWEENEELDEGGEYVEDDVLNIYMHKGPYAELYESEKKKLAEDKKYYGHEETRLNDGWYLNNYTNGTDRWTFKVDYMESSGSYNAGFASMVGAAYSKHPLQDYLDVLEKVDKLGPVVDVKSSLLKDDIKWDDYRTSLKGFPVLAFQKRWNSNNEQEYLFIGYYRMLLDKGSDEVLGFKPSKKVRHKLFPYLDTEGNLVADEDGYKYKALRDVAECWEFSTNNRGYCSYRDPYSRVKLSFKAPENKGIEGFVDGTFAPVVTNDFEYRYHAEEDGLDAILNYKNLTSEAIAELNKTYNTSIPVADQNGKDLTGPKAAQDLYVDVFSKNWEEVCQWIYSTNLDDVIAEQTYSKAEVGEALYEPGIYYIYAGIDEVTKENKYEITSDTFNNEITYYLKDETKVPVVDEQGNTTDEFLYPDGYKPIKLVNDSNYVYTPNKFYQSNGDEIYSIITDEKFDSTIIYYESRAVENFEDRADLLVRKASEVGSFNREETYYTYNDQALVSKNSKTGAVQLVSAANVKEEDFDTYYVAYPVTYLNKEYAYDTQEYRAAKFVNELKEHFDLEYLATYFIMTEVFECYDSRGKNCMMASWGPQKEGGKYIWYPIFYDIDTQLGINNTGIPSFEYNVDATEEGNYSTNDSILWNNFYNFFKNSYILDKYKQLRNSGTIDRSKEKWYDVKNPPLVSIDNIEQWYLFNPDTHDNIACRGVRPLIATNLDEYFKYITITNENAVEQGVGYLEGNEGVETIDDAGTFFYALQGDRSQSREQFLTNRLEYIDSWLGQMNYSRGGGNRIRGRISANNMDGNISSDHWIETENESYWTGEEYKSNKRHEFDAEYWLKLTPVRSAYVTAGDDSENYQPQRYDGITPVTYELTALESGIRASRDYNEQLLYIYGLKTMRDVGDMSKLYWTEFNIEGEAPKLIRLQLGYDGLDAEGNGWYNRKINGINLKAKMPLLREANFSNLNILSNNLTLNLSNSPKLENFRAVGSNLTTVYFADGAALNTVYMPNSLTHLNLNHTNMLTKLITTTSAPIPDKDKNGNLIAEEGLYLDGMFGDSSISLQNVQLKDVPLGYQSYTLLQQLYHKNTSLNLTLTGVDWCPYTKLVKGDTYNKDATYYLDNGHYGFSRYEHSSLSQFNVHILNGEIYRDDHRTDIVTIGDEFLDILNNFIDINNASNYHDYSGITTPEISGIVYIENTNPYKETDVAEILQKKFPNLTFFFKNINKAYSAKFVLYDEETRTYSYVPFADGSSSIPSVQKVTQEEFASGITRFKESPFIAYQPKKDHYDFQGWSVNASGTPVITSTEEWNSVNSTLITEDVYDYIYYACFIKHSYNIYFYNNNDPSYGSTVDENGNKCEKLTVTYGENLSDNVLMPQAIDATELEMRNTFKGWTLNRDSGRVYNQNENINNVIINVSSFPAIKDYKLYAVFQNESVYNSTTDLAYFTFTYDKGYPVISINTENGGNLSGKITLPAFDNKGNIIKGVGNLLAYRADGNKSAVPDVPLGSNITHIFFAKDSNYEHVEDFAFTLGTVGSTVRKLTGVYLPDTIRTIGNYAFYYQYYLEDVILNDNITSIGINAFDMGYSVNGKAKITTLPKNLTSLGDYAFQRFKYVELSSLPDGIEVIPKGCFQGCPRISIDTFGGGNSRLTTIESNAFRNAGQEVGPISNLYFYSKINSLGALSFEGYGSNSGPNAIYTEDENEVNNWDITTILGTSSTATINHWNGV